jgi:crotonobetainyl-CoA:carnitine CoA-transferase CaiB-like acyl-CoA transferase
VHGDECRSDDALPVRRWPAEDVLRRHLTDLGLDVGHLAATAVATGQARDCPVLAWAASGGMALTGWPEAPAWPDGDVMAALDGAARLLAGLAERLGGRLSVDTGQLLCARAAARPDGPRRPRRGTVSFGGACRLLEAADEWVAVNLSRPEDVVLLPALTAGRVDPVACDGGDGSDRDRDGDGERLWASLAHEAAGRAAAELVEAAQELGMPASVLGGSAAGCRAPWSITTLGRAGRLPNVDRPPLVVDFSALWAGPLCAHLLARAGARVVTFEAVDRPDGARVGDPQLHAELHRGHDRLVVDFASLEGRRRILSLVASADVVVEASRPRALATLGLDAAGFVAAGRGRTWVSITGYGRDGPQSGRVAFGDDAAVAGGLVGRDEKGVPVFCADAIADPVTGVLSAVAALASMTSGGGHLIDCSMAAASAFVNQGGACPGAHRVERRGDEWTASCDEEEKAVPVRQPWRGGGARRPEVNIAPAAAAIGPRL